MPNDWTSLTGLGVYSELQRSVCYKLMRVLGAIKRSLAYNRCLVLC